MTRPACGFPFIGTFVATFRGPGRSRCLRAGRGAPLFNFELHGVDLLDATDGTRPRWPPGSATSASRASVKIERLVALRAWLAGREWVTLAPRRR